MKEKKGNRKKKILKIMGIIFGLLLIIIVIVPLLIPIRGASGLKEPEELLEHNGAIVTLPFEGTDGIDTHYIFEPSKTSSETNFILIHGSLYNSSTWNKVIDYLSTKGNVYAYDQTPYGLSEKLLEGDWNESNPYTIDASIIQLEAFMDKMNIEKAILVGSSFGGVIATEAALKIPEKVEALVLVDAAIYVTESVPKWVIELPQIEHLGPLFVDVLATGDGFYESTYFDKTKLSNERMKQNKSMTEINNWNLAYWEYLQAWSVTPSDASTKLSNLSIKTLVISGENDEIVPLSQSKKIAKNIEYSTFEIIESCGHLPHEEMPDEFIRVFEKWLTQ